MVSLTSTSMQYTAVKYDSVAVVKGWKLGPKGTTHNRTGAQVDIAPHFLCVQIFVGQ